MSGGHDIDNLHPNTAAAAQFAIDRRIDQNNITIAIRQFQADTGRQDMFEFQWPFFTNNAPFVLCRSKCANGG
ncbi:hypothetical protein RB2150_08523 [Rhodobacterales bacterium HTCC2150]|nr:hypothetical protein RB2150_08523 [Rhodobacterales bacterium HTCC2150] [Rhodobacteraceae bacterium HTCC2150]